jgi:hypothetical protein
LTTSTSCDIYDNDVGLEAVSDNADDDDYDVDNGLSHSGPGDLTVIKKKFYNPRVSATLQQSLVVLFII